MAYKTVITQWVHPEIIDFLSEFSEVIPNQTKEKMTDHELIKRSGDAHAIMVFMPDTIDDYFLQHCLDLKIVSAALKGYDNFDVDACTRNGIWFSMVPDLLTIPTAELAVGLLINISRNMHLGNALVKSGRFEGWRPTLYGKGLAESKVGIIGLGRVGVAIAERLKGFGSEITYHDPSVEESDIETLQGVSPVSIEDLLSHSDFIVVATPYAEDTHHLIKKETIDTIKDDAYLINIGRGSCVDESAVAKALINGNLAGYAADVFEFEDWARVDRPAKIPDELLESDQTYFTPHLGSAVDRVRFDIAMEAAVNIKEVLTGNAPHGAINSPLYR